MLDLKTDEGKRIFAELLAPLGRAGGELRARRDGQAGVHLGAPPGDQPALDLASLKGFGLGTLEHAKAYEPIAQATGGAMSTTGLRGRRAHRDGRADRGLGQRRASVRSDRDRALPADSHGSRTAGARSRCATGSSTCAASSCATSSGSAHGPLNEYPNQEFGRPAPRSGNASGGGHPGWAVRCKPGGPNDWMYMVIQPQVWGVLTKIGRPELLDDPDYDHARGAAAPPDRDLRHDRGMDADKGQVGGVRRAQRDQCSRAAR